MGVKSIATSRAIGTKTAFSMAYALVPVAGEDLWVNKWNWHPTIELLVRAGVFSSERAESLHFNCGGDVTAAEVVQISKFLSLYLLSMSPGERLLNDGTKNERTGHGRDASRARLGQELLGDVRVAGAVPRFLQDLPRLQRSVIQRGTCP